MIVIIKHVFIEGPGLIQRYFRDTGYRMRVVELEQGDALPRELKSVDAVVILGGPMNVYEEDRFPFLRKEDVFIKDVLGSGVPVLGICLGAQLLAKALGGKVKRAERREIGWYTVPLNDAGQRDPLFRGQGKKLGVFQWHGDKFEVPEGGVLLAESPAAPQAFRYGNAAYGLQFHVEVTPGIVRSWLGEYGGEASRKVLRADAIMAKMLEKEKEYEEQACRILSNFCRLAGLPEKQEDALAEIPRARKE